MIVLTSVLTDIIPGYVITYDTLLISIFVVTNRAKEVYEVIAKMTNHGATIIEGEGS